MISERQVKGYCCEDISKIENYDKAIADNFKGWHCHHHLETHTSDGERRLVDITMKELKALDMYYHRPASELIFITATEHRRLHHKGKTGTWKGKHFSDEHKRKISEAMKGIKRSEKTKAKLSAAKQGQHWKLVDEKRVWY